MNVELHFLSIYRSIFKLELSVDFRHFCCTSVLALFNNFRAWTSCPCPMDMLLHAISIFLANCSMLGVGSEPMLRKHIIGVFGLDSACIESKSVITGSAYFGPSELAMYFRDCDRALSMHHALNHRLANSIHSKPNIPSFLNL